MKQQKRHDELDVVIAVDCFTICAVFYAVMSFLIMYLHETPMSVGLSEVIVGIMYDVNIGIYRKKKERCGVYLILALLHLVIGLAVIIFYIGGFGLISTIIGAVTGIVWTIMFVLCHIITAKRDKEINEELKR